MVSLELLNGNRIKQKRGMLNVLKLKPVIFTSTGECIYIYIYRYNVSIY